MFIFIAILMFFASISPYLMFPSFVLSLILAIVIANTSIKKSSWKYCRDLMLLIMFQNLLIGCGAHLFENSSSLLKFITQIPFMVVVIMWIWPMCCRLVHGRMTDFEKCEKYFLVLNACIAFSLLIGHGSIQSILLNFRNMTCFFMFFQISRRHLKTKADLDSFLRSVFKVALIFLIFGVLLLIGGYSLYEKIGFNEVYIAKGEQYLGQLDDRFTTVLFKEQVTRMGSLMYEPVNLAYFYAYALIASVFTDWAKNKYNKYFYTTICLIGLLLTFGKGGYMIVVAAILFVVGEKIFNRINLFYNKKKRKNKLILFLVGSFLISFASWYYLEIGAAAKQHFWGVIATFYSVLLKPIGYGLGTGGNAARTFSDSIIDREVWLASGGETAIMSFMYQIGIQGMLFFVLTLCSTSANIKIKVRDSLMSLSFYIPFISIGIGLLQDNTFTVQCIFLPMMLQGALYNINDAKIRRDEYVKSYTS